ncbi:MAG: hypothetical protein PHU04_03165 [Candidatus Peribacteraceae bacterium]|nr:hypothetical protein [Candidatus Peribacteraceae bacterium]
MKILRKAPILAILTIGICLPIPALAYLSPEEVFGIELPAEPSTESLPSPEETAVPPANGTDAASDENGDIPSDADTETVDGSDALLRPAAEEEVPTDTARTFYRGGEPVDIAEPLADPNGTTENQPTEEEVLPAEDRTDDEGADPDALIEALQAAERQAEITEEEETPEEEEPVPSPAPSAREEMLSGIGGIEVIGIAAILGALSLGAFMLLKKKMGSMATLIPEKQQQTAVPPPPAEQSSTRLQEVIEEIKEETAHNGGTTGTDTGAQQ